MNEDTMNMSIRKFLKKVGVTSQREIEMAVRAASEKGAVPASMPAKVTLEIGDIDLNVTIDGKIDTA